MANVKRGFASDNNAGVHPRVMDAIRAANQGHAVAYGDDAFTELYAQLPPRRRADVLEPGGAGRADSPQVK